jgi:hypothetical protein
LKQSLSSHPFPSSPQRDEVIVKIVEGVHPAVILGKHKYRNILNAGWPWDPSPESCVFIYNYQSNGDPSDRAYIVILANPRALSRRVDNWREYIASDVDVPPRHFRDPYPTPTWVFRPSHLSGLALTLPDSLPHTPESSPEPPSGATEDVKPGPSYSCKCRVSLFITVQRPHDGQHHSKSRLVRILQRKG